MRERLPNAEASELRATLAGKTTADIPRWLNHLSTLGIFDEVRDAVLREIELARSQIEPFLPREDANLLLTLSELLWNQVDALGSLKAGS